MPAYGDLVIIVTPKGKRSLRRVDENQDMHTQDGILRMADVVEAPFGSEVCTDARRCRTASRSPR